MKNLNVILVISALTLFGCVQGDPRLYGSWKSDSELSTTWNRQHGDRTEIQNALLSQFSGHMTDTFFPDGTGLTVMEPYPLTVGTITHAMPGFTNSHTYAVIRRTKDTVVVKRTSGLMAGNVETVHFDGQDKCWLLLNEDEPEKSAREYFRRIGGPNIVSERISVRADENLKSFKAGIR